MFVFLLCVLYPSLYLHCDLYTDVCGCALWFMQVKRCFMSSSRVSQHHQQTVSHLRSARARQEAIPPLREALRQRGGAVMTRSRLRHTPMYVMCVSLSLNDLVCSHMVTHMAFQTLLVRFQPINFVNVVCTCLSPVSCCGVVGLTGAKSSSTHV